MTDDHAHIDRPSPWIERFAPLVAAGARVLDVACGHGRHARLFAARGHDVVAVDRDAAAIAGLAGVARVDARRCDLEGGAWPFAGERFGAIVVTQYLHRPLFEPLFAALAPDGAFLYETFARGNEAYGRPSNPDFLLAPGELVQRCGGALTIVAFEQGWTEMGGRTAVIQRIAALGRARPWPPPLPPA
jgi:SAM-dependent methyltransferase